MADPTCVIFSSLTAATAIKRKDDCGGGDKYIGYGGRGGGVEFRRGGEEKERVEILNPRNAIFQAEAEETTRRESRKGERRGV